VRAGDWLAPNQLCMHASVHMYVDNCDISAILLKLVASQQMTCTLIQNDRLFDVFQPLGTPPVLDQCTVTYLLSLPSLPPPLTVARRVEARGQWRCLIICHSGPLAILLCLSMGTMATSAWRNRCAHVLEMGQKPQLTQRGC